MIYNLSVAEKAKLLTVLFTELDVPFPEDKRSRAQYARGEYIELLVMAAPSLSTTSFAIADAINMHLFDEDAQKDNLDVGLNVFQIARQTGFEPDAIRGALRVSGFIPRDMDGNYVRNLGSTIYELPDDVFFGIPGFDPDAEVVKVAA